jgi:GAF domain-containing protein/class 3 adenylate cyclase
MKSQINSKPKILVVDDEPDNLDLLYRTFYRDYQVLRAISGPAALELLAEEGEVSVIISDQRMPIMSGTEFLSITATQYPDTIRIILTGYTDVEDLVEAINAGKVFKYVTKPWEAEKLTAVVRQALDTHNVLKARTRELTRTLRQESLLNTVTNTIRSALDYRQILQTIVDTVGDMLEVDVCLLRPVQDEQLMDEQFIYEKVAASSPAAVLAQTVWETREVQIIHDVAKDKRIQGEIPELFQRATAFATANIASSLVVPLICQQELIAVLALHQCSQSRSWSDDEIQLVLMVADQAALALSQAYAYDQVRALAKREALINTITTAIRSSLDPQDIFAAITQQLGQALQVNGCVLSLWGEDNEFVDCVGLYDSCQNAENQPVVEGQELVKQQLPAIEVLIKNIPILQEILQTQEPVVITDMSDYASDITGIDIPGKTPARSLMVVPLLADGKCIGSITLRESNKIRQWLPSDIELAQAVAAQAAIAVQQSRLYHKTREQAKRLLQLDKQKTEFFQNISHEFRTPITLIQGPLESAVACGEGLSYQQSAIALRNSRRLLRLVNQLLDLQRLDAGRMQPSFRPCNLVEFVTQIVESFRPYCEKKRLQLLTQVSECPQVYLDMEKFDKVVYNLLSNAIKFTPENGKISVILQSDDQNCKLQVQDTGIGILPAQIPQLFQRFRQAEGSENRSHEGSGLGLALVKELVEMHGGKVTVDSTYGEGTTFTIWLLTGNSHLPKQQVIETAIELNTNRASVELADLELVEFSTETDENISENLLYAAENNHLELACQEGKTPGSTQHSILVVDDNPDLRSYVSDILRRNGYHVITARNGYEGFRKTQETAPSLIITDLMMPMVTGVEMIQMIRNEDNLQGTPIILLTAKVDEETRIESTEHGADAYLAKPFNDRELLAEVKNLLALKANERRVLELNNYLTESVLKRFLPAVLVKKAATGTLTLDLRPEPRLITILFSDIVGFTQLANTLRSRRVAQLLNEYLETMTKVVSENGGTVDKFMGDAILALYGAPEELTPNEQVRRAIKTARGMQASLAQLNQRWQEQGIFDNYDYAGVQFRCGIHQGTAVVGMFGSAERADYTAIGPSVNIAARLQAAAVPSTILVSAAVADYLQDDEITKCSPLQLKGIDETVLTFAVKPEIMANR